MKDIKLVTVILFALSWVPGVYPQCNMISRYQDFTNCITSISGNLGSLMNSTDSELCFDMMETVALCVEEKNEECGQDDIFSSLLNARRIRDSGGYICKHIDEIMKEILCMESSGKIMEFMTCKAMAFADMIQSEKNDKATMCGIFAREAECVAIGTESCGLKYLGFMKSMFPSDEQCSRLVVSTDPDPDVDVSTETDSDMDVSPETDQDVDVSSETKSDGEISSQTDTDPLVSSHTEKDAFSKTDFLAFDLLLFGLTVFISTIFVK